MTGERSTLCLCASAGMALVSAIAAGVAVAGGIATGVATVAGISKAAEIAHETFPVSDDNCGSLVPLGVAVPQQPTIDTPMGAVVATVVTNDVPTKFV